MPLFNSETGRRARQRKAGLASAGYWREREFENLVRAREARSRPARLLPDLLRGVQQVSTTSQPGIARRNVVIEKSAIL